MSEVKISSEGLSEKQQEALTGLLNSVAAAYRQRAVNRIQSASSVKFEIVLERSQDEAAFLMAMAPAI